MGGKRFCCYVLGVFVDKSWDEKALKKTCVRAIFVRFWKKRLWSILLNGNSRGYCYIYIFFGVKHFEWVTRKKREKRVKECVRGTAGRSTGEWKSKRKRKRVERKRERERGKNVHNDGRKIWRRKLERECGRSDESARKERDLQYLRPSHHFSEPPSSILGPSSPWKFLATTGRM